jgi:hypothetical protein
MSSRTIINVARRASRSNNMWIKRTDRIALQGDDIAGSEITPQRVYEMRAQWR